MYYLRTNGNEIIEKEKSVKELMEVVLQHYSFLTDSCTPMMILNAKTGDKVCDILFAANFIYSDEGRVFFVFEHSIIPVEVKKSGVHAIKEFIGCWKDYELLNFE